MCQLKSKNLLLLGGVASGIILAIFLWVNQAKSPNGPPVAAPIPTVSLSQGNNNPTTAPTTAKPVRINIPKLGVSTNIESVGQDINGRMDVPKDVRNVAWYNLGYKVGERGNAVIAGHLDDRNGNPAVFYNLASLVPGDEIIVSDDNEAQFRFMVVRQEVYDDAKFPLQEVFGSSGGPQLVLITCTGTYNPTARNYSQRIVIYSELI